MIPVSSPRTSRPRLSSDRYLRRTSVSKVPSDLAPATQGGQTRRRFPSAEESDEDDSDDDDSEAGYFTIPSTRVFWLGVLTMNVFCLLLRDASGLTFTLSLLTMNMALAWLFVNLPRTLYWGAPPDAYGHHDDGYRELEFVDGKGSQREAHAPSPHPKHAHSMTSPQEPQHKVGAGVAKKITTAVSAPVSVTESPATTATSAADNRVGAIPEEAKAATTNMQLQAPAEENKDALDECAPTFGIYAQMINREEDIARIQRMQNGPEGRGPWSLGQLVAGQSIRFVESTSAADNLSHVWSRSPKQFMVRQKGYPKNKKLKGPSTDGFYDCVGVDLFSSKRKLSHIFPKLQHPPYLQDRGEVEGVPTVFIVNFQLPVYFKLVGPYDGEGYSVVFYFKMNARGRRCLEQGKGEGGGSEAAKEGVSEAAELLKKFIKGWSVEKGGLHARLKCLPICANRDDLNLGSFMKNIMATYDAKPFLTGPKYHVFHEGNGYLEVDIDFHRFIWLARQSLANYGVDVGNDMVADLAMIVQGQKDHELPESVLGSLRVHRLKGKLAIRIKEPKKKKR